MAEIELIQTRKVCDEFEERMVWLHVAVKLQEAVVKGFPHWLFQVLGALPDTALTDQVIGLQPGTRVLSLWKYFGHPDHFFAFYAYARKDGGVEGFIPTINEWGKESVVGNELLDPIRVFPDLAKRLEAFAYHEREFLEFARKHM